MKKRLDELFTALYNDENEIMLNLFCVSLISSDSILNEADSLKNIDMLLAFKSFVERQPVSKKQNEKLSFIKTAEVILERDLELFRFQKYLNNFLSIYWVKSWS